jgi:hypothetical protein
MYYCSLNKAFEQAIGVVFYTSNYYLFAPYNSNNKKLNINKIILFNKKIVLISVLDKVFIISLLILY